MKKMEPILLTNNLNNFSNSYCEFEIFHYKCNPERSFKFYFILDYLFILSRGKN